MPQEFELIKVLAELLRTELDLTVAPPRVFIYNQKWNIPDDDGLFVNVSFLSDRVFSSNSTIVNDPLSDTGMTEELSTNVQETYQIDVFSRDNSARLRKHEVIFALRSLAAQQACETYSFKIGSIPSSFIDLSQIEASARLNRYALRFNLLRGYSRTKSIDAFTNFTIPPSLIVNQ